MKRYPGECVRWWVPFLSVRYDIMIDECGLFVRWTRLRLLRRIPRWALRRVWGL